MKRVIFLTLLVLLVFCVGVNATAGGKKTMEIKFAMTKLPENVEQFTSMPEFGFSTPAQTAALFIVAMTAYPHDKEACHAMIDSIKGPQKLSQSEKSFIRDRMASKADYIGKAYFKGATPQNNYTPAMPYTVIVEENAYTYQQAGYAKVYVKTAGADSPRPVMLRQKGSEWFLWEFFGPLTDIRIPAGKDPWS